MTTKALFLDRDGVINIDSGYVCTPERFELIDGIINVMKWYQSNDFLLIIVTNQAGIARGFYSEAQFIEFDKWVRARIRSLGVFIEKTYYSPYHPEGTVKGYNIDSPMRKPRNGMLLAAISEFNISAQDSVLIGDKVTDIQAALATRVGQAVLVGHHPKAIMPEGYIHVETIKQLERQLYTPQH